MIVRQNKVAPHINSKPGWGRVDTFRLSDAGALTQFGASLQVLLPGAKASIRHWHEHVDEFLFVVSGEVTVTENDGHHTLVAGDSACWPAGVANGHTVSNRSDAPCSYLIVGTRDRDQFGHYVSDPDIPDETNARADGGQPDPGALERSVAARAWTYGWAISRSTEAPVQHSGYFRVHVGKPGQITRYVLPELDRELLGRLVSDETAPGTWLKVCAPLERVVPLLSSDWDIHAPEFLMSADLARGSAPVAAGYSVQTEHVGALVRATIVADTGELAASGQAALDGAFATFDQIVTDEAHRRKGLGRSVMAALSNGALDFGARHGVLVATEAGAALYKALGWTMVAPVTAASVPARKD